MTGTPESGPGDIRICVADIVMSVDSERPVDRTVIPEVTLPFLTDMPAEVRLRAHSGGLPPVSLLNRRFSSSGLWTLYRDDGKWVVVLRVPEPGATPYATGVFSDDFRTGDLYLETEPGNDTVQRWPLAYPMDELLLVNLLARSRGVLLHALGARICGQGVVFAGVSGSGKSTLAELLQGDPEVDLLSDDRVAVRKSGGGYTAYGTPWFGDARAALPTGVPLRHVFVIDHAAENHVNELRPLDATTRLLVRSFPTFWDEDGMTYALGFLGELAQTIPCRELGFVAHHSVVDYVKCLTCD